MKSLLLLFSSTLLLAAEFPLLQYPDQGQKIAVQNSILSKVNGKTISMMDVKKKMDLAFHQSYPQLSHSNQARLQFYEVSWRPILMDMINHELILSDATDKEIQLTDGEIREAFEERFGPSSLETLDKIGLTYEEGIEMIKNELIVQRMTWWFVHSKAMNSVTPQEIRQAYRLYLEEHPPYADWNYRVISIRTEGSHSSISEQIFEELSQSGKSPEQMEARLKELEAPGISISISNPFQAKTEELSEAHKASLAPLSAGTYSHPSFQISRGDKKSVYRIFYLIDKVDHPAPSFETLSQQLKNDLTQKAVAKESTHYLHKLQKRYSSEAIALPEDLHPFSLQ